MVIAVLAALFGFAATARAVPALGVTPVAHDFGDIEIEEGLPHPPP